jgi:hypothetical protein
MKSEDREELAKSLIAGVCVFCCVIAAPMLVKFFGWLYSLASFLDNNL